MPGKVPASALVGGLYPRRGNQMKKFVQGLWSRIKPAAGWLWRKSPSLNTVQGYVDTTGSWLFWIAVLASFVAGVATFLAVLALSILPYVTLTHCLYAAPVAAIVVSFLVYGVASRPSDVADKASWIVWLTNHSVRLVSYLIARFRKRKTTPSSSNTP